MGIDITKLLEIIKDPDLKLKIHELYGENLKLKEENFDLKNKLKKLNEEADITNKLQFENNHYILLIGEGNKEGPFCTKCWDADKKLVRLHDDGTSSGVHYFICPNCQNRTQIGTYIQQNDAGGVDWGI